MGIKGKAYIAGVYEHLARKAEGKSVAQFHPEAANGALEDAALSTVDVDGYFFASDAPRLAPL